MKRLGGGIRKLGNSLLVHGQLYHKLAVLHIIADRACLGVLYVRPLQHHGAVLLQLLNGLVHHVDRLAVIAHTHHLVIQVSLRVMLCDKVQGAGLAQLLQDGIGIRYAGNLDIDPIAPLLINHCLRAVTLHTLLQLVDGVCHILTAGIFIAYHLIGDTHTALQVQSQINAGSGT